MHPTFNPLFACPPKGELGFKEDLTLVWGHARRGEKQRCPIFYISCVARDEGTVSGEMAREMGLGHDTSGSWRVGDTMSSFSPTPGPGPSRPSPAGPATGDPLGPRAWLTSALAAAAGPPRALAPPAGRAPGPPPRTPRERGGGRGSRGLTGDTSRRSPGGADPRPPLPPGPAPAPRPSLTPPVRRLLHRRLLRLPPLGRGSGSGSARRRRRRPRERRRRRLQNAHARSTQAPPPAPPRPSGSASRAFDPAFPRRPGVFLKGPRGKGWGELRTVGEEQGDLALRRWGGPRGAQGSK